MRVITDFHLHSKWSRACSKNLTIPNIAHVCERKGIHFVGTSDFTHPAWRAEIGRELTEESPGTFTLAREDSATRFLLSTEVSCIYKKEGRVRRVHHCILASSLSGVDRFIQTLESRGCNLRADGRPIIGIDSEDLIKILLEADPDGMLIPAHAWTPWFSVFGSMSGFDSLQECFGDMTKHVYAIETGLSSDPKMNWRLPSLDQVFLVSNSDAHSLDKLGREANVFEMSKPNFSELRRIMVEKDVKKFIETIEFFPEEGKYHADGHRLCHFSCTPKETKRLKGLCPKCGKPLTVGVLHRVDELAKREEGERGELAVPYRSIVPLVELVASVLGVGSSSKKVAKEVENLLQDSRTEFGVLLDLPERALADVTLPEIVEAIIQMRNGNIDITPGYDGEYGVIRPVNQRSVLGV